MQYWRQFPLGLLLSGAMVCGCSNGPLQGSMVAAAPSHDATASLTSTTCTTTYHCVEVYSSGAIMTTDDGITWHRQPSSTTGNLAGVSCADSSHCMAVGDVILGTTDGGLSWYSKDARTNLGMESVSCADVTHCVAVGAAGAILFTGDGGQSWQSRSPVTANLDRVNCPSSSQCVAVGVGAILVSNDGGATWSSRSSALTAAN